MQSHDAPLGKVSCSASAPMNSKRVTYGDLDAPAVLRWPRKDKTDTPRSLSTAPARPLSGENSPTAALCPSPKGPEESLLIFGHPMHDGQTPGRDRRPIFLAKKDENRHHEITLDSTGPPLQRRCYLRLSRMSTPQGGSGSWCLLFRRRIRHGTTSTHRRPFLRLRSR